MADIKQVVVIGAGYTGMLVALGAAKRAKGRVRVTLVNPWERFTERLRMHQIATGQQLAEHRIPDLVAGTGIDFARGWATGIDTAARTVTVSTVDDGRVVLGYDTLVYAIGSTTDTGSVPGVAEHAFTLNGPRSAQDMAAHLARQGSGEFLVCGAGLTGIEAATEIAESHPNVRVTLLSRGEPAAMMGARARAYLMAALDRLGVTVRAGVSVTKVLAGGVELEGGEFVAGDGCLWTTGVRVAPLATEAGIATDEQGRIRTDAMLRSVSHPEIYAIGDAAAVPQAFGVIHGTCQSGMPTAAHAAENIARQLRGKQLKPFRFGYLHQPVSLGRRDAVIQFTYGDDTPRRWCLTGRAAVFYKETVSSSPIKTYGLAKRLAISSRMLATTGGKRNKPVPRRCDQHQGKMVMTKCARVASLLFAGLFAGFLTAVLVLELSLRGADGTAYTQVRLVELDSLDKLAVATLLPALLATAVLAYRTLRTSSRWPTVGALVLLVLIVTLTITVNLPINADQLHWNAASPPADWTDVRDRWQLAHAARTAAAVLAFALLAFAAPAPTRGQ